MITKFDLQLEKDARCAAAIVEFDWVNFPWWLERKLRDYGIFCEVWAYDHGIVAVGIERGDWKHDHARADYLVSQLGGKLDSTDDTPSVVVTEEDGSDCYSAVHYYRF